MSNKAFAPELKKLMDKKLAVKLNGNRRVIGTLRGFDQFLNIVLDETTDETQRKPEETASPQQLGLVVIRGNSIVSLEPLEKL